MYTKFSQQSDKKRDTETCSYITPHRYVVRDVRRVPPHRDLSIANLQGFAIRFFLLNLFKFIKVGFTSIFSFTNINLSGADKEILT